MVTFETKNRWLFAVFLILSVSLASANIPISHVPRIHAKDASGSSTNWAGYAVTGSSGSVSFVSGSWIVPSVDCVSTPNAYSSFWTGIDGFSSNSVEQTGTDSDCSGSTPVYYAWYEFYPKPSYRINAITVKPGDVIFANVSYVSGIITVSLKDITTGQTFSKTAKTKADRSSAEWIVEAPYSGGILPLANFGSSFLGFNYTAASATNYATVNGVTGPVGSFGNAVQSITMVSQSNNAVVKALPSGLTSDGTSNSVTWQNAGP